MKIVLATLVLILVLLQVRLWSGSGSLADIERLDTAIATQTGENAGLETRNKALMDEVSDLRNGLDSIEERARNELGLIRKGETFYLIVDEEPQPLPVDSALAPTVQTPPDVPAPGTLAELAADPDVPLELPPALEPQGAPENPYLEMFRDGDAAEGSELPPPEPAPAARDVD